MRRLAGADAPGFALVTLYIRGHVSVAAQTKAPDGRAPRVAVERYGVLALAVAAGIGAAFAGARPTGTHVVDQIEVGVFGASFCVLCSRSSRVVWIVVGFTVAVMSRSWLLIPAGATELVAVGAAIRARTQVLFGGLLGALGVQVILRWPPLLFHGLPSLIAAVLTLACAGSAWANSPGRVRRRALTATLIVIGLGILAVLPLAIAAILVRNKVTEGQDAARAALAAVGEGNPASVAGQLGAAERDASNAASTLSQWWIAPSRLVPVAAQQSRLLSTVMKTAAATSAAGEDHISAIDYKNLEYHHGHLNLARLRALGPPGKAVDKQLHVALRQLKAANSDWIIGPIRDKEVAYENELARATHTADLALSAVNVLPAMLGGDGTQRYLVAFMSPSESRGYDGFIGSYGVLTATNGRVTLTQSGAGSDLDASLPPQGGVLKGVPQFLKRYGAFNPGMHARDATYSPDFPTDADVFTQLYEQTQIYTQSGGPPIDGVLGIDPYGLAAILQLTGPIEVPGLPVQLSAQNAARILLKTQYTTFDVGVPDQDQIRHDFLQQALHIAFDTLVQGNLPSPRELSDILDPLVREGRIVFWSAHSRDRPLIRKLDMAGSFPATRGKDLLALTTQNAGNNKIDAFLHKSINDSVRFDSKTGVVDSTVTIKLVNDAPSSGLPAIVINSPGVASVPPGNNITWLSLYSPLHFTRVTVDGRLSSFRVGREFGVFAYSQFVQVPAEGSVTLEVDLEGRVGPGAYALTMRLQPSANPQINTVEVGSATAGGSERWKLNNSEMVQSRSFGSGSG